MNDSKRHINKEVREILLSQKDEVAFKGTILEGKPRRYTVINEKDRRKYLTDAENAEFESLLHYYLGKIEEGRAISGKEPFNAYLVINTDESYVNEIVEVIKRNGHWSESVESGWLVEFKNGQKQIMTEQVYAEYTMGLHPMLTEGRTHKHFFDIQDAIKSNPDTSVLW